MIISSVAYISSSLFSSFNILITAGGFALQSTRLLGALNSWKRNIKKNNKLMRIIY